MWDQCKDLLFKTESMLILRQQWIANETFLQSWAIVQCGSRCEIQLKLFPRLAAPAKYTGHCPPGNKNNLNTKKVDQGCVRGTNFFNHKAVLFAMT